MKIGVDLDHTVYGFPEFFREFIPAMAARGHQFFCTSGHTRDRWERDRELLAEIGIDADLINPCHMPETPARGETIELRQRQKASVAGLMDLVFDDHADFIQPHTTTPIFRCPGKLSADKGNLKR